MIERCEARVRMTATFPLTHHCPFRDEVDEGTVEIAWTTNGYTLELHAVAKWLGQWGVKFAPHEEVTADIAGLLGDQFGIDDVTVVTRWTTAGAEVVCRALPRERVVREGA